MIQQIDLSNAQAIWNLAYSKTKYQYPFLSYQWHKIWVETFAKDWQPLVLQVSNDVIAPFAIRGNKVIFTGGYEIADYLDLVGDYSQFEAAWKEIIGYLKINGITEIELRNVPQSSPTISFFSSVKADIRKEDSSPILKLPHSWDEYLAQLPRKHRHELRRKLKKFEREQIHIEIRESQNPTADVQNLIGLMKLNPNKKEFFTQENEAFFHQLASTFAEAFKIIKLFVDNQLASAIAGFQTPHSFLLYNSGFDEARFPGSGFYLKAMHIKRVIEADIREYNFLQGTERYKYELGARDFEVYEVTYIF